MELKITASPPYGAAIEPAAVTERKFSAVNRTDFDAFLKAYPRPLVRDVAGMCEPPLVTFNDFSLGKWPECIVASHCLNDRPDDPWKILEAPGNVG